MTDTDLGWDIPGVDRRAAPPEGPLAAPPGGPSVGDGPPQPAGTDPAARKRRARPGGTDGAHRPAPAAGIQPDSPAQALQYGGRHALTNLTLLCRFHHLVAIHRWGWQITRNPDGTTTAVSPDGTKTLHSHPPPVKVA